jgi:membrane protein DedA with SNARE-associated domain
MTDTIIAYVASLDQWPYVALGLLLMFSGYLVPIPEEILLLISGYLASVGAIGIPITIVVSYIAIFIGDFILFEITRHGSSRVTVVKERLSRMPVVQKMLASPRHTGRAIFILRFIIGLRFLGAIIACTNNVSRSFFMFYDGLALLIYVPLFVFLGYRSYDSILLVVTEIESVRHGLFIAGLVVVAFFIFRYVHRKLRIAL